MTKKRFFILFLFLFGVGKIQAQELFYGLKGGLDHPFLGKFSSSTASSSLESNEIGWHSGAFAILDYRSFFLQPEITYSSFQSSYSVFGDKDLNYQNNRLNLGVLLGRSFLKVFRFFLGPILYLNLKDELNIQKRVSTTSTNKAGIACELGLGLKYLFLVADIKYHRALSNYQNSFYANHQTYTLSLKPNTLSLSLGFVF